MNNNSLAAWGEQAAAEYLLKNGWRILDRNWRCRAGELDIIAAEPCSSGPPTVVAVEVKTRAGLGYGSPLEAITRAKTLRLRRLAAIWRRAHPDIHGPQRLDAIAIVKLRGYQPQLTHVRGIS
jgi:putative endonuclease